MKCLMLNCSICSCLDQTYKDVRVEAVASVLPSSNKSGLYNLLSSALGKLANKLSFNFVCHTQGVEASKA